MTFRPIFKEQEELWNYILHSIDMIADTMENNYEITKEELIHMVENEYKIIEHQNLIGLYYLIKKSFDKIKPIAPTETVTYGAGNSSLICNLLGLSGGAGATTRIAKIMQGVYLPEIYYGPADTRLDFNPTNIRMSNILYKRFIEQFIHNLSSYAENSDDYAKYDFTDFETLRNLELYFTPYDLLDELCYLEIRCPLSSHVLLEDNEHILDIICQRNTINKEYSFKILPEEYHEVISLVKPNTKEELSYAVAIATIVSKPDHLITHIDTNLYNHQGRNRFDNSLMRVFAEDYLNDKKGERFIKQRTLCQQNQIFPKCHIDRMIDLEWLFCSYYNMMYM